MAGASDMVDLWGSVLAVLGNLISSWVFSLFLNAFFPRRISGRAYFLAYVLLNIASRLVTVLTGSTQGYGLRMVCEIATYWAFSLAAFRGRWDRRLFVVVAIYASLYSVNYWLDFLIYASLGISYETYVWNIPLYSATFVFRLLFQLGLALLTKHFHRPLVVGKQARAWVPLSCVFPASTLLILWQIFVDRQNQQFWQTSLLILNVVDVVALLLLDHLEESAAARERLAATTERARVQDENLLALSQAYEGQRKLTHDFRAQPTTLSGLLDRGEWEEAKAFLGEMKVRQTERILLVNSHHAAIDAVLNQKGYAGQQRGIDMRFRVNDLSALKLPRVDVTIVLGNLLDNAMEACADFPPAQRWVSVQIMYFHNSLSLTVVNPSRPVQIVDGQICTTKPDADKHGFGLRNVRDILDQYKAEYNFAFENGRFIFTADWPDIQPM